MTGSLGVHCQVPDASVSLEDMLWYADKALYLSKRRGRNRVTLYTPENPVSAGRD